MPVLLNRQKRRREFPLERLVLRPEIGRLITREPDTALVRKQLLPHVCDELVVQTRFPGELRRAIARAGTGLLKSGHADAQTLQFLSLAFGALPEFRVLASLLVDKLLKRGLLGLKRGFRLFLALPANVVRAEAGLVVCAGELLFEFQNARLFLF